MAEKVLGIDIGRGNIKIVCGSLGKGKFTLHGHQILKTPKAAFGANGIINSKVFFEDEITQQLPDVIKHMGCKGIKCSLTISDKQIIIRERKLPFVPQKELREIVILEAQSFLPGPLEDFVVDYRVIDKSTDDENELLKVLIVAAPRELIDSYRSFIERSGLKIMAIDIKSSCITNYAKKYILREDMNTLVVDIGAQTTKFIMYNGKSYFAELEIDGGGDEVNFAMSEFLNMSDEDVERKKMNAEKFVMNDDVDLSQDEEDMYFNIAVKRTYEKIAQEIRRVMDYYRTRRFSSRIDNVIMIGGASNMNGIAEYIQSIADVPVSVADIPEELSSSFGSEDSQKDFSMIIPAIGAVLRGK
ncbi:type IV pilus assembly protein PilM [Peptoclostridium litorale DSM 5388]|uniref:Type IV pilus assembly protein PilM n=1 Tax=Peptoclostridium litorale DSM 5388 TaxID=1121324 RepID=A0A069R9U8_PEPLI|nr:pilus assembly protein PilM [Peptoclostridium litorale]KDR93816.1 type IV pilus assembly protein PilM [Peptoclostridium litorale DSM 5388]SIN86392.1 type IV pilus assembly protein PilM [Peptoclostridium litorale DSM 5388]